jgi:hypothetical protein
MARCDAKVCRSTCQPTSTVDADVASDLRRVYRARDAPVRDAEKRAIEHELAAEGATLRRRRERFRTPRSCDELARHLDWFPAPEVEGRPNRDELSMS